VSLTRFNRLDRVGLVDDSVKEHGPGVGHRGTLTGLSARGDRLMDIKYKKCVSVNEWDLGKETPT
jgi:hypothetical protein